MRHAVRDQSQIDLPLSPGCLKFTINVIAIVFYNFKSFFQHKFQIAWQGLNIISKAPSIFRSFLRIVTVKNNNISFYFDGIL